MTPRVTILLPAAGLSTRFGRNKLTETLHGKSVILRSVEAFLHRPDTAAIVLATPPGRVPIDTLPDDLRRVVAATGRIRLVEGGASRAESVRRALALAPAEVDWVAVHDAARPLVSGGLIDRLYAHAAAHGNAIPALAVKLTIKQAAGPLPAVVERTLPRAALWEMQTPQVMRRADLTAAYARCAVPLDQVTDDAQVLEAAGFAVWLVAGEEQNLKLTTPHDLWTAERALA